MKLQVPGLLHGNRAVVFVLFRLQHEFIVFAKKLKMYTNYIKTQRQQGANSFKNFVQQFSVHSS